MRFKATLPHFPSRERRQTLMMLVSAALMSLLVAAATLFIFIAALKGDPPRPIAAEILAPAPLSELRAYPGR